MPKKVKGKRKQVSVPVYDSDDERTYEKEKVPDPTEDDYFLDEVDQFHSQKDKVLLGKGIQKEADSASDSQDEVLGLDLDDDDDDDLLGDDDIINYKRQLWKLKKTKQKDTMGSDIEDEDQGLPDSKAWGKRRSKYYGGDVSDDDLDLTGSEDDETAAALEEKEALNLQKKMAAELDDMDFGLDIFKQKDKRKEKDEKEEKIEKDLSKLSKKERLQLLKKDSPEMLPLIEDFKTQMTEIHEVYIPLHKIVKEGKIQGKAAEYVNSKVQLGLNYCTNISFYMMLKAKHIPVHNHPVIKRLVQYRNLIKQLEPVDQQLQPEIQDLIQKIRSGVEVNFVETTSHSGAEFVRRKTVKTARKKVEEKKLSQLMSDSEEDEDLSSTAKKRKKMDDKYETEDEKQALEYYKMMKAGKKVELPESEEEPLEDQEEGEVMLENMDDGEEEGEGKRAITYQIQKNKGLIASKKKELRNPRVKHRMKFRKAKIRRRGQVREHRFEKQKYGGEVSGIRAGIKRGIKMKV